MATTKQLLGSQTTLLSTELNSLGSGSTSNAGSAFDNTIGQTGDGYVLCDVELVVTHASSPAAGGAHQVWFLQSQDGTNYDDGSSSVTPPRAPDLVINVRAVSTAQRITKRALLPAGKFKAIQRNDASTALASSGNTLKVRPVTFSV